MTTFRDQARSNRRGEAEIDPARGFHSASWMLEAPETMGAIPRGRKPRLLRRALRGLVPALAAMFALCSLALAHGEGHFDRGLFRIDLSGGDITQERSRQLFEMGLDIAGYRLGAFLDFIGTSEDRERIARNGYPVQTIYASIGEEFHTRSLKWLTPLGPWSTNQEALAMMEDYAARFPDICRLEAIGQTLEGRTIWAMKVSDNAGTDESGEPKALMMGCHHARELISIEVPLRIMKALLDGYGTDPYLTMLVDTRQTWIVPIVNPDGYEYVATVNQWWRKNRRNNGNGTYGVDPNRNYGFQWGRDNVGSSPLGSAEDYRGTSAFSEPESSAIRDLALANHFVISASVHSYSQLLLFPWGYQPANTADHAVFTTLASKLVSTNGYAAGNTATGTIYPTNGDSDDWLYGEQALKEKSYAFTWEVGTSFFPADSEIEGLVADVLQPSLWMIEMAGPAPMLFGLVVNDADGDRLTEQDEELTLLVTLKNYGIGDLTGTTGTLECSDGNATVLSGSVAFGDMATGVQKTSALPHFRCRLRDTLATGSSVPVQLRLNGQQGYEKVIPLGTIVAQGTPIVPVPTETPSMPAPTLTATPSRSPTPFLTPTGTASATPTRTPSVQPTATRTGTPSPTPSSSPTAAVPASVLLTGYWNTDVEAAIGGFIQMIAVVAPDSRATGLVRVELGVGGFATGLALLDDGLNGDFDPGDGVYGFRAAVDAQKSTPGVYTFQLGVVAGGGDLQVLAPFLTILP